MEVEPGNPRIEPESDLRTLLSSYSNQAWRRLAGLFPTKHHDSNLLSKFTNFYYRTARSRSWRRRPGLPLPLPSNSLESTVILSEASRVYDVLDDMLEHILSSMHIIQKSLQFWQLKAEGTNAQKAYFMVFERGPRAFINGTVQLIRGCSMEGFPLRQLCHSAATQISEKIAVLTRLRCCMAAFLSQVYLEVDNFGEALAKDPEKSLPSLLMNINSLLSKLEESINQQHEMFQSVSSASPGESNTHSLQFEKLPNINQEGSQWTDCEIRDAINLVYQNLDKLNLYIAQLVSQNKKPRRVTLHWFGYTCGAVGLSVCSLWLVRHSSLAGSSDIDNWIREAQESTVRFWNDHVEQPILSIRDELFETFRRRHKGVMDLEEVQLTSNSLHRMLLTFSEQTRGQKFPQDASDQEMMEIVMARYEKDLMHPIQNLLGGEIARALLIQIQKLKLDIETAMLDLNQILKANEINFAILAALPAFFLSVGLLMLVRTWYKQDKRAEGRGRIARLQRRLLVVEVEKRIMQFQTCLDKGQGEDAQCMLGLVLYSLDRLYKSVERHAKETGEWLSLREDIIDLGKPQLQTMHKLAVTSRLVRVYDCMLPSANRR
ncbi:hypothetical protein MKW94_006391 [Papaver nudicaule]|uniref:Protein DGS1, mitochondrial n=1 Tax=Papaver nudicaule TaxID=74823 RepID=A0AA41VMI6_PAPNU|nr:hypothetical protein [Papaver nudicaule]